MRKATGWGLTPPSNPRGNRHTRGDTPMSKKPCDETVHELGYEF